MGYSSSPRYPISRKNSTSTKSHIPPLYLYSEAIYQSALLCECTSLTRPILLIITNWISESFPHKRWKQFEKYWKMDQLRALMLHLPLPLIGINGFILRWLLKLHYKISNKFSTDLNIFENIQCSVMQSNGNSFKIDTFRETITSDLLNLS